MSGIPEGERRVALEFLPPIVYVPASRTNGPDGAEYLLSAASNQMLVTVDLYQGVEEEAEQVFRTLAEQI